MTKTSLETWMCVAGLPDRASGFSRLPFSIPLVSSRGLPPPPQGYKPGPPAYYSPYGALPHAILQVCIYIYIHASKCHSFNNFEAFQFGSSSHSAQVLVAKHVFDSWISVLIVGGIIAYAGPPAYAPSPPPYTYSPPSYGEFLLHCVHNVACLPSILPATSELQQLAHIWCPGPPPYTPPPYAYSPPSYGESLLHCLLCCSTV